MCDVVRNITISSPNIVIEYKVTKQTQIVNTYETNLKTSLDSIAEYIMDRTSIVSNLRKELKQKYPKLFNYAK